MTIVVTLYSDLTGLTLEGQPIDSSATPIGSPLTSGFAEIGGGSYLWNVPTLPAGTAAVKIQNQPGHVFTGTVLSPADLSGAIIAASGGTIPPAPSPNQVTVYLYTRDATGAILTSVPMRFKITEPPASEAGSAYDTSVMTITSNASTGLVSTPLPIGATVKYWSRVGVESSFVVPASGPYQLPDVIGDLTA